MPTTDIPTLSDTVDQPREGLAAKICSAPTHEEVCSALDKLHITCESAEPEVYRWFQFCRKVWPPPPVGPCRYCGQPTSDHNEYVDRGSFRHDYCWEKHLREQKQADEGRKQIDLYKRAIREVENEKLNASGLPTCATRNSTGETK